MLLGLLAGGGCTEKTTAVPDAGRDYYPVAVGNYWVYAVRDTTWSRADINNQRSMPRDSSFQFRESITETYTDAAGKSVFRLQRAKRRNAAAAWVNDSAFSITLLPNALVLNRANTRTVELIYPPREGRSWNLNAFNDNFNDTILAETRHFQAVGKPYVTGASAGLPAASYANTITTENTGAAAEVSAVRLLGYRQVYAKGIGPVFRRRVNLVYFSYASGNQQITPPGAYTSAFVRRETLIDYHVQ